MLLSCSTCRLKTHSLAVALPSSTALSAAQQQAAAGVGLAVAPAPSYWSPSATHVVQEDSQPATTCLLAALLAGQCLTTSGWVTAVLAPKIHVGTLPEVGQYKPRETLIQAGSGAPVAVTLPEQWAHSRSLLQGLRVSLDASLVGATWYYLVQ
jgi:hypothetical protein